MEEKIELRRLLGVLTKQELAEQLADITLQMYEGEQLEEVLTRLKVVAATREIYLDRSTIYDYSEELRPRIRALLRKLQIHEVDEDILEQIATAAQQT